MRWQGVVAVAAGAICGVSSLAVTGAASAQAAPAASGPGAAASPWGKAIEVPGLGSLNKGGDAFPGSISCVSAGNCAAAGMYADRPFRSQGFVVSESKGRWGKAIEVPGLGALNKAGNLLAISVSCGAAGDCAAGGSYLGPKDHGRAFVASEENGKWGKAIAVPGLGALNTGKDAELTSVSCSPGRNCTAGGSYRVSSNGFDAYVISERNGRWGKAMPVPGLNASEFARLRSLSCASAGNCSAGGSFSVRPNLEGFVVSEKNGKWGKAIEVPGLSGLNRGGEAEVDEMSCASAGNCSAGGTYFGSHDDEQAFVVSEKNGKWGKAITVPGLKTLNAAGIAIVESISCASPGNCAVGGTYKDSRFDFQGYVVSEKNGTWGQAIEVPGLGTLNKGGSAEIVQVSCGSAGNCAAGGDYLVSTNGDSHAFVASENKGVWGKATQLPGLNTLNFGTSAMFTISCPSSGRCAAGGSYEDRSDAYQGFVVSQR